MAAKVYSNSPIGDVYDQEPAETMQEEIEILKQFDGFIDPDGNFYGTCLTAWSYGISSYAGSFSCHEDWAEARCDELGVSDSGFRSYKDALVKGAGYVSLTLGAAALHEANLTVEHGISLPPNTTTAQAETLHRIWLVRGYDMERLAKRLSGEDW